MRIENRNSYRMKKVICGILGLCAALVFTSAVLNRQEVMAAKYLAGAQKNLSEEVFRFHVLANSDSKDDQKLKLKVRDAILSYMEQTASETELMTAENTKAWAIAHLDEMEQVALDIIRMEGYNYSAKVKVQECYFPDRKYGDILFPKGYYEALRVEIGNAAGHNWWCVLYPSLCFMDATCAVVTDEGQQELEKVLCEEDYEKVTAASENFKIKSFFLDLFREKTSD